MNMKSQHGNEARFKAAVINIFTKEKAPGNTGELISEKICTVVSLLTVMNTLSHSTLLR